MGALPLRLFGLAVPRVPRRDVLLVLAVLLPAAVLRLWRLDAVGLRGDEAVYAGQAAVLAGADGMDQFILASRGNSNFLIFQGILSVVYRLFGVDDLSARLLSAGFAILTVPVIYVIGRLLYGRSAGFFAALVFAVSGYAVALGRLALLDSAFTLFGTVAVFCMVMFCRTARPGWMYGFVAVTALTMQVKVVGVLLLPVAMLFAFMAGMRPRFTLRRTVTAAVVGVVFLAPAWVQLATIKHITAFLSSSTTRSSGVPWNYYFETLFSYEGLAMTFVYGIGLVWAALRPSRNILLPVLWLAVILLFLQVYSLKAFNYLLPVMPALALLAGRAVGDAWEWLRDWWAVHPGVLRRAGTGLGVVGVAGALVIGTAPIVSAEVGEDSSAGLREAARWLARNGADTSGVMTISHGSAQYVLSFYGGLDAYPFGRFRLATVLPGGEVVAAGTAAPDGGPSRDWVVYWPPRLIYRGAVSYLVYYTGHLDDPPTQEQFAGTTTQQQFQSLIARYGGELVHTVNWDHEPRVYIYKVTKRLPFPGVSANVTGSWLTVTGEGFVANSQVTVTYRQKVIATGRADDRGEVELTMPAPGEREPAYHVVVTDAEGNDASAIGLPPDPTPGHPYEVRAGDSLRRIAAREYGSDTAWRLIWQHNKDVLPDQDLLHTGQTLTLPNRPGDEADDQGNATPARGGGR